MYHQFCLRYYLIIHWTVRCFSLKQTRQEKLLQSFCCWMTLFSWLLFLVFLVAANSAFSNITIRSFVFIQLVIGEFVFRMTCQLFFRTSFQFLDWCAKVAKIRQDFHKTAKWSLCFLCNAPCTSDNYLPMSSQKSIQVSLCGSILSTYWDTWHTQI